MYKIKKYICEWTILNTEFFSEKFDAYNKKKRPIDVAIKSFIMFYIIKYKIVFNEVIILKCTFQCSIKYILFRKVSLNLLYIKFLVSENFQQKSWYSLINNLVNFKKKIAQVIFL